MLAARAPPAKKTSLIFYLDLFFIFWPFTLVIMNRLNKTESAVFLYFRFSLFLKDPFSRIITFFLLSTLSCYALNYIFI